VNPGEGGEKARKEGPAERSVGKLRKKIFAPRKLKKKHELSGGKKKVPPSNEKEGKGKRS